MQHLYMNLEFTQPDYPPEVSGDYLVITSNEDVTVMCYSSNYGLFNCRDNSEDTSTAIRVKWWAPLPKWLRYCGRKQPYHNHTPAEVQHD